MFLNLLLWILFVSTSADACETIVGGSLDGNATDGGPWLNIFPDLIVPVDGFVTQITFRKQGVGLGFVSFWRWKEDMIYEIVAKIPIRTTQNDSNIVTVEIQERIFVQHNLSIGVHHESDEAIFTYVEGNSRTYRNNVRDGDLQFGSNISFSLMNARDIALELVICESCEETSLGALEQTDSGGPWLNLFPDIHAPISGYVTSVTYLPNDNGTAYISFWNRISEKEYEFKTKVEFTSVGATRQARTNMVSEFVYVDTSWSVAIHHRGETGILHYVYNGTNRVYYKDVRDSTLPRVINISEMRVGNRSVALNFTICICEERVESHCELSQCDRVSGYCLQGCDAGYYGDYCDQACQSPQFGLDCNSTCHCLNSTDCDPVNGTCPPGGCEDGYEGDSCSVEVVLTTLAATRGFPTEEPDPSIEDAKPVAANKGANTMPIAVGVAVGVGAALVLVIILVYIARRKNVEKSEPKPIREESLQLEKLESIPINVFHKWRKGITKDMLKQEFHKMETQSTKSTDFASNEVYGNKNKFNNVLPYDDNRVVLDPVGKDPTSEYINASPIPGYDSELGFVYIACQGPQSTTVDDFWRMAWQFRVYCIVMLTNLVENYKEKCVQYWPSERIASFSDIQVSFEREEDNHDVIIRHLKVTKNSETRYLRQFQYTGWPDHGVPLATSSCMRLQQEVAKFRCQNPGSPVAVHCSAGVGRTGTFIALDQLLDQAETRERLNVAYYVKKLRLYRMKMIQTFLQYEFLYMALDQHLTVGITSIDMASPVDTINPLVYTDEGKQRLCDQFQFLEDVHPPFPPSNTTVALRKNNVGKNRDTAVLPADDERILLEPEDEAPDSDYINAVMVKGDDERSLYCMTQVPLPETTADFWRLILQNYIQNIVYLRDTHREQEHWLPPNNQELTFDLISVTCVGEEKHTDYAVHSLNVGRINEEANEEMYKNVASQESEYANTPGTQRVSEVVNVRLFFLPALDTGAETHDILTATLKFLDVLSCHRVTGQPVAIVCMNGANDCGVFLGCDMVRSIVAQRSLIDIFSVVHRIKLMRPQCITTLDQYRFLHRLAVKYNIQLQGEA